MKKLFSLLFLVCFATVLMAQISTPRFGITPNSDNTGRVLTYKLVSVTDVAGNDAVVSKVNAYETIYKVTLLDSITFSQPVVTSCALGDKMTILMTAASGTPFLKFTGDKWINAGKATLSSKARGVIVMIFDGAKWVEVSRVIQ